ncbi:MAG: glucuronate isomerase [Dermatophilaceae bacterium]
MSADWVLDADRLLPAEPATRRVARRLYEQVRELPIISPHGHVPARWLADDEPFTDPAALLITPDHYVCRLLHASGVDLAELGVGQGRLDEAASRRAWRAFCERWPIYRGTPVRYWMETELVEIFGVTEAPTGASADDAWDRIATCLARAQFRPRALYQQFGIEVIATTDDPCDSLEHHRALAEDPTWHGRVLPTFRPDAYLEPAGPQWPQLVARLGEVSDSEIGSYPQFIAALEQRRRYFIEHGAVSADHSHVDVLTLTLPDGQAEQIFTAALRGQATEEQATALRRHLLVEMARMSVEDGLVMTLHPGVVRGHHGPTAERFGPDTGHDIPVQVEFTRGLRHLLERFGTAPGFHLILFTLDETVFSREVAPLAGFYPSVYAGAPWWFLDAPDAIRRYRRAVTETAGFTRTSGFIDDTRAFCSIPARHDMARRLDCGYLAELVAEHRLAEDEAAEVARELVAVNPKTAFKL